MSKTVKRVSKTVKTVMRVMMIGLVAMLGAKVEAHWVLVKGRCVWHSGECARMDKDVPTPVPILLPIGEVIATPKKVEILCPKDTPDVKIISPSADAVQLVAKRPIARRDITNVGLQDGSTTSYAEWGVPFSDKHFLVDPSFFCQNSGGPQGPPEEAIILEMSVKMNLYCSSKSDKECFSKPGEPHSTWQAETCTLPVAFDVKNLPPRGTPYECSGISHCHAGVCEKL